MVFVFSARGRPTSLRLFRWISTPSALCTKSHPVLPRQESRKACASPLGPCMSSCVQQACPQTGLLLNTTETLRAVLAVFSLRSTVDVVAAVNANATVRASGAVSGERQAEFHTTQSLQSSSPVAVATSRLRLSAFLRQLCPFHFQIIHQKLRNITTKRGKV